MIKLIILFIICLGLIACSEPEPNLELTNPEAFSFDLGESWEVNSSVKAKGFAQFEENDSFNINLSYSVDFLSKTDTLIAIYNDKINKSAEEEILDYILEAQIEVDSTFSEGNYKLIFNVQDEISKQEKSISVDFNLSK